MNNNNKEEGVILTIDPSSDGISGYFLFRAWHDWEIGHFEDKNWLNHTKFFHNWVKNNKVSEMAIETTGNYLKGNANSKGGSYMATNYIDLIRGVGVLFYIGEIEGATTKAIMNLTVDQVEVKARRGEVIGLKNSKIINKATKRLKNTWTFKNRIINEHEKDALLIFYIYWVMGKKNNWPWTEWD